MRKIELIVPECIKYLSDWKELWSLLPQNEHIILDKHICGCGATEMFINSGKKVVHASPRKHLLFKNTLSICGTIFTFFVFWATRKSILKARQRRKK